MALLGTLCYLPEITRVQAEVVQNHQCVYIHNMANHGSANCYTAQSFLFTALLTTLLLKGDFEVVFYSCHQFNPHQPYLHRQPHNRQKEHPPNNNLTKTNYIHVTNSTQTPNGSHTAKLQARKQLIVIESTEATQLTYFNRITVCKLANGSNPTDSNHITLRLLSLHRLCPTYDLYQSAGVDLSEAIRVISGNKDVQLIQCIPTYLRKMSIDQLNGRMSTLRLMLQCLLGPSLLIW